MQARQAGRTLRTLRTLPRTFRTVSHLRASQVWHRVRLSVRRRLWTRRPTRVDGRYRARAARCQPIRFDDPGLAALAALRVERRDPAAALEAARDALIGCFTFLGEMREVGFGTARRAGVPSIAWDRPDLLGALLWKTHLHEFSYAADLAFAFRTTGERRFRDGFFALARDWSSAQPIGKRGFQRVAWNERAVATRLVHWAVGGALLGLDPDEPDARWLSEEIARHALFLRDNLALDLLGNHLFRDCFGLAVAEAIQGSAPGALGLFARQVAEQILPDGAHGERCPMYHAICLADLVDLRALLGESAPRWLRDALARAGGFLETVTLGDGDIALLGDGWRGEVDVRRLLAQAARLEKLQAPVAPEHASGLVLLERGAVRCVVRAGPHGPDHQLGHAHADLLSFDVSVGETRVVTDTGTCAYEDGPARAHLRSTAAHNTVQVDGAELLEAWSSFRAGRRGRARVLGRGDAGPFAWLHADHDAYAWLPGQPRPQRLWLVGADEVFVLDAVRGEGSHRLASRLHLHPDAARGSYTVRTLGGRTAERSAPLSEHWGEARPMRQLAIEADAALPWTGGFWIHFGPHDDARPSLALDGTTVRLRLEGASRKLAIDWHLDAPPDAAVAIEAT